MTDELRNQLRGMADGAAARTSDLDTGRLVEFVGAARRRRDRRQKVAVGGLSLAVVGGLTFGGIQIFGDGDVPVASIPGPSDNAFCGWNVGEGWPADEDTLHMLSGDGSTAAPSLDLTSGERHMATSIADLDLMLFNNTGATFEADSVIVDVYVARGDEVIAASPQSREGQQSQSLTISPGGAASAPVSMPLLCPNETMAGDGPLQVYAVARASFAGDDGDLEDWKSTFFERSWGRGNPVFGSEGDMDLPEPFDDTIGGVGGGAWTVLELTDIRELPEPAPTEYSDSRYCRATDFGFDAIAEPSTESLVTIASPSQRGQWPSAPDRELARGGRTYATTVDDMELHLLNATDVPFSGLEIAIDVYVMGENGMVAAPPTTASSDTVNVVDLEPEGLLSVPIRKPVLCPGQSYDGGKRYTVYARATALYPDETGYGAERWRDIYGGAAKGFTYDSINDRPPYDPDALRIWGGPWTVNPLSDTVPEPVPEPTHEPVEREISSEFPRPEDAQCGDVFPIMKHADDVEPRLVGANFLIDIAPDERGPEYGHLASGIHLSIDDVSGPRVPHAVWLLNPEGGEHIIGNVSQYATMLMVRDGLVVGTYEETPEPDVPFNLDPGYALHVNSTGAAGCERFDEFLDTDEIYFALQVQHLDDASDSEQDWIWGGPWNITEDGTADLFEEFMAEMSVGGECTDSDTYGDDTETSVDCPFRILPPENLTAGTLSATDLQNEVIAVVNSSSTDTIFGGLRPQALVEISDADGNVINPGLDLEDEMYELMEYEPMYQRPMALRTGVGESLDGGDPIEVEPGTYTIRFIIEARNVEANGRTLRMITDPLEVELN